MTQNPGVSVKPATRHIFATGESGTLTLEPTSTAILVVHAPVSGCAY